MREDDNLPQTADRGQCDSESCRRRRGSKRERWEADRGMGGVRDRRGKKEQSTYTGAREHKVLLIILHFPAVLECCLVYGVLGCFLASILMHLIVHATVILSVHVCPVHVGPHIGSLETKFIMCP